MTNDVTILYKNIEKLCSETGISINKLVDICGLPSSAVANLKNLRVWMDHLTKIADYFNISIDELMGRSSPHEQTEKEEYINKVVVNLNKMNLNEKNTDTIIEIAYLITDKYSEQN